MGITYENTRRFERLFLDPDLSIKGAQVCWPNGERTFIVDISYKGAAFARPTTNSIQQNKVYNLELDLKREGSIALQAEVMWASEEVVGVQFADLNAKAQKVLHKFLSDRIVGAYLQEVAPEYFSQDLDCDHWYHAPGDVDLYIWLEKGGNQKVSQAVLNMGDWTLNYNQKKGYKAFYQGQEKEASEAQSQALLDRSLDILSQLKKKYQPLEILVSQLKAQVTK